MCARRRLRVCVRRRPLSRRPRQREQEKRWRKGVVVYSGIAWLLLAVFLFFWKPPGL
jgi:hypothetical protein